MSNVNLQGSIGEILFAYGEKADEMIEKAAKKVAKKAKKELEAVSPKRSGGGKRYSQGWRITEDKDRMGNLVRIHNVNKPGLAHLLEYGHVTKNGTGRIFGQTPAHPHIEKINQMAQEDFLKEIESALKG